MLCNNNRQDRYKDFLKKKLYLQMMCCRTFRFRFHQINSLIRRGFKLQKEWRHVLLNCPFVHLSVCMFVRLTICPFVCLNVCLFACSPVCLFACLPVCCLPVCLFVFLSVCLFVRLTVCPFDQSLKKENRKLRKTNSISSSSCLQPKSQSRLQKKISAIIILHS